jgi:tetratricopeptide (TPR) repeat protein
MKRERLLGLITFTIISSATIAVSSLAQQPDTIIYETISSNPSGAEIFWGKTPDSMTRTEFKTPFSKHIEAKSWEPWCYQIKKEYYFDSLLICRPEDFGDRDVNFDLKPVEIPIGPQLQGWDIYWGSSPEDLAPSGFKTPHNMNYLDLISSQEKQYFLLEYNDERSSGIFYYKTLLADYHQQKEEYEKAISLYRESLKAFPPDYYAHLGIANCYSKLKDFDNAIEWYVKIVELVPSKAKDIYPVISILYAGINQCETAEKYLHMTSELLSDQAEAQEPFLSAREIIDKCFVRTGKKVNPRNPDDEEGPASGTKKK